MGAGFHVIYVLAALVSARYERCSALIDCKTLPSAAVSDISDIGQYFFVGVKPSFLLFLSGTILAVFHCVSSLDALRDSRNSDRI